MSQTQFQAEIKELKQRTGADCEKVGRLVLEFIPSDETMIGLTKIYQPQTLVDVIIKHTE